MKTFLDLFALVFFVLLFVGIGLLAAGITTLIMPLAPVWVQIAVAAVIFFVILRLFR